MRKTWKSRYLAGPGAEAPGEVRLERIAAESSGSSAGVMMAKVRLARVLSALTTCAATARMVAMWQPLSVHLAVTDSVAIAPWQSTPN